MSDKIEIDLSIDGAQAKLEALRAQAATLKQELQSVGDSLASKPSATNAANFFQTSAQLSAVNSTIGAIEGSAVTGGTAATFGSLPFAAQPRMQNIADPNAAMQFLQAQGVSGQTMAQATPYLLNGQIPVAGAAFNPSAYVQSVLDSAQPQAMGPAVGRADWDAQRRAYDLKQNPLFAPEAFDKVVYGPSSSVGQPGMGLNSYLYDQAQKRDVGMKAMGAYLGYEAAHFAGNIAQNYTQSIVSGQPHELETGSNYGTFAGMAIGAFAGFKMAGPYGAIAGATIGAVGGPLINALQAPYIQDQKVALNVEGANALMGGGMMNLYGNMVPTLKGISDNYNTQAKTVGEALKRMTGVYTGIDTTSPQDVSDVYATLVNASFAGGSNPQAWGTRGATERLIDEYGRGAPAIAKQVAGIVSDPDRGGNLADTLMKHGVAATTYYTKLYGGRGTDSVSGYELSKIYGASHAYARDARLAGYDSEIGNAHLSRDLYAGMPASRMGGDYDEIRSGLNERQTALRKQADTIARLPDGTMSEEYKRLQAEMAQVGAQQKQLTNQQSTAVIGEHAYRSAERQGQLAVPLTRAMATGTDSDIRSATADMVAALRDFKDKLTQDLRKPGLTDEQKSNIRADISKTDGQMFELALRGRETEAQRAFAGMTPGNARSDVNLHMALRTGTAGDVARSTAGSLQRLSVEESEIDRQLSEGGLSAETTIRLKTRKEALRGERYDRTQDGIDAGFAKQDIAGYGLLSTKLSGAIQRAELAPFSPGNIMGLELGQVQLNKAQLGVLNEREQQLRAGGNLSPERALEIEQQRQGLLTQNYSVMAHLSDGILERLPALAANAGPRYQGRYTTDGMAAILLNAAGIDSTRVFGAANGNHAARQEAFWGGMDDASGPHMPSRGMQGNNAGNAETNNILRDMLGVMRSMAGRGNGRTAEALGGADAMLQRSGVGDSSGGTFN